MKKMLMALIIISLFGLSVGCLFNKTAKAIDSSTSAATCAKDFLGLPTWYKYLDFNSDCTVNFNGSQIVSPDGTINDSFDYGVIWKITFAIIEMLLMVAGYVAVIFVFIGAFGFATAQGSADKVKKATQTVTNGVVGAAIAILASKATGYIVGKFAGGASTAADSHGLITASGGPEVLRMVFNIGLTALGAISVLIIIISGIQFVTSGGTPDKITKARNTIYYALAGLAIAIFGAALVNFILGKL